MTFLTQRNNIFPSPLRLFIVGCIAAFVLLPSCKNNNTTSIDALPIEDIVGIKYDSTYLVSTQTQLIDSVRTLGEYNADFHMIGNYIDNEMGRIQTGTYTQFNFPGDKLDFGNPDSLQADSITLDIDLIGYFGRVETPQTLNIYEITQEWDTSKNSSNDTMAINRNLELSGRKVINKNVLATLNNIHVRLDKSLAEKILHTPRGKNNADFVKYFKGLYITTSPIQGYASREPGAILYASLTSLDTKLKVYYSLPDSTGAYTKAKSFDFLIPYNIPHFHSIKRTNYSEGTILGNEIKDSTHLYEFMQGGALSQLYVKFPNIENLGKVGVNKVELILHAEPTSLGVKVGTNYRYAPPNIDVYQPDATLKQVESALVSGSTSFNASTKTYSFILTNYVQQIINGTMPNRGIILRPTVNNKQLNNMINRVVLGGANNPKLKPQLKVYYTTLPK